jgi:hypothetical protein
MTARSETMLEKIYTHRVKLLAIFMSLVGIYFRIQRRASMKFGGDEFYSSLVLANPFWEFLKQLPHHDFCGYLNGDYYLVYPFFKIFGANKWGLAIPHLISVIIGFYFFIKLVLFT